MVGGRDGHIWPTFFLRSSPRPAMPSAPAATVLIATLLCVATLSTGQVATGAHVHAASALPASTATPAHDASTLAGWWHRHVHVTLYLEALCPYCAAWLAKSALQFDHDYGSIAKLHVVPWGNARVAPGGAASCQHGEDECFLNTMYACAIHAYPRTHWLPLLACASSHYPSVMKAFDKCAGRAGVNATSVRACAESHHGAQLADEARRETEALIPQHSSVPWFVVERLPLGGESNALAAVVCAAWRGARPAVCYRPPPDGNDETGLAMGVL